MNLFDLLHERFVWPSNKEVKVFEAFAGIGSQAKALERKRIRHSIVGISEVDKDAIVSYAAIHCRLNECIDTFDYPEPEEMIRILQSKDVGYDFKNMRHTITSKTHLDRLKKYYLADVLSKNFGNVSKLTVMMLPKIDLLTYSFPCQDLSRAGLMKGMSKEDHTRSGLLWEIERILDEMKNSNLRLPTVLLMENVPEVIGTKNKKNFMQWYKKLEDLGYQSYIKIINAEDHDMPQHRERCFMVSILGNYNFVFPKNRLKSKRLIDLLENEVDMKYYLSYKTLKMFMDDTPHGGIIRSKMFTPYLPENRNAARTVTTRSGYRPSDNFLLCDQIICLNYVRKNGKRVHQSRRILDSKGIAVTITCGFTGYYIVDDGPKKQVSKDETIVGKVLIDGKEYGAIGDRLVRRLTPKEALRLMGFDDQDIENVIKAGVSENQILKQAGNSIVVNILEDIFMMLFE